MAYNEQSKNNDESLIKAVIESIGYQLETKALETIKTTAGIDARMPPEEAKQKLLKVLEGVGDPEFQERIANITGDLARDIIIETSRGIKEGVPHAVDAAKNVVKAVPVVGTAISLDNAIKNGADATDKLLDTGEKIGVIGQKFVNDVKILTSPFAENENPNPNQPDEWTQNSIDKINNSVDNIKDEALSYLPNDKRTNINQNNGRNNESKINQNNGRNNLNNQLNGFSQANIGGSNKKRKLNATLKLIKLRQEQHGGIKRIKKSLKQFRSGITSAKSSKLFGGQRNKTRRK